MEHTGFVPTGSWGIIRYLQAVHEDGVYHLVAIPGGPMLDLHRWEDSPFPSCEHELLDPFCDEIDLSNWDTAEQWLNPDDIAEQVDRILGRTTKLRHVLAGLHRWV